MVVGFLLEFCCTELQGVYRPAANEEGRQVLSSRETCVGCTCSVPRSHQHLVYSRSVSPNEYPGRSISPAKIASMRFPVDFPKTHTNCGKCRAFRFQNSKLPCEIISGLDTTLWCSQLIVSRGSNMRNIPHRHPVYGGCGCV